MGFSVCLFPPDGSGGSDGTSNRRGIACSSRRQVLLELGRVVEHVLMRDFRRDLDSRQAVGPSATLPLVLDHQGACGGRVAWNRSAISSKVNDTLGIDKLPVDQARTMPAGSLTAPPAETAFRSRGNRMVQRALRWAIVARPGPEPHSPQDRPKMALIFSGSHPQAVWGMGVPVRCSTTTRRLISPLWTALRKAG